MTNEFLSIFAGTFILEDGALAAGIALVADGKIDFFSAFLACFIGISIGDILLYILGYLMMKFRTKLHWQYLDKMSAKIEKFIKPQALSYYIVVSRFVPGTRLPTYLCAGYLNYSFWMFVVLTIFSVAGWVLLVFLGGRSIQLFVSDNWLVTLVLVLALLHFFKTILPKLLHAWDRKALKHSWRKWTHFEFWPAWFFYIPIYFYYTILSLKTRSFFTPFYANPEVLNGGLLGESKWDFLKYLKENDPATLKTILIPAGTKAEDIQFPYPFIIKPDVGQRGFGVRIIRQFSELEAYLQEAPFALIIQELSLFKKEAGLFYIRKPEDSKGSIYSITDKIFPFVTGDGRTKLGDLILKDRRARIMAAVYFDRLRLKLDDVPALGELVLLSECGNHCQGAIFLDGKYLKTSALEEVLENISRKIPHFYFGRFDIRYESEELLKQGKGFQIVEINGAGAEATHIWDAKTKIWEAYASLFDQWRILFSIGKTLKKQKDLKHKVRVGQFFKESFRVFNRKNKLSVSS